MPRLSKCFLLLMWGLSGAASVHATHIRSADIIVTADCNDPLLFSVTVRAYLNTASSTKFGTSSRIYFGDGSPSFQIPVTDAVLRPELGAQIAVAEFTTTHRYEQPGTYTVAYIERDRSRGIVNIFNSEDTPYVTFVNFTISPQTLCNRLPVLTVPPLDKGCFRVAFEHNSGAYDPDGDSLSYELAIPAASQTTSAVYTSPVDPKFFTNYQTGNEDQTGVPTFSINPVTGLLSWDAPGLQGEYNIAFRIIEWRKDPQTDTWFSISATTRDMQIVVVDCQNNRPVLTIPPDVCVIGGTRVEQSVFGADPDQDVVRVQLFSEVLQLPADRFPATYTPNSNAFFTSAPPHRVDFLWQTDISHVRSQAYQVVAKITDDPVDGPKLTAFGSWQIKVVAPAPELTSVVYDVVNNHGLVSWQIYPQGASKIQIWRKVGPSSWNPSVCSPGAPRNAGFFLVGETTPEAVFFRDTNNGQGLSPGAVYCYRIVAYFNPPASVGSLASDEICIGPVRADAPVITHVTVEKTDTISGKIRVSWRSPQDINRIQFPPPYAYEIYKGEGLFGDNLFRAERTTDTTWLDNGINTAGKSFHYKLVLFSKPDYVDDFIPVDTSAVASSVWLSATPEETSISLIWRDSVPWTNVVRERPWHRIYRAEETTDPERLVLLDSVDVTLEGFTFTDRNVRADGYYSYVIQTVGSYGNPAIPLQLNRSQLVSSYPVNDLKPCTPVLTVDRTDCSLWLRTHPCDETEFSNRLTWSTAGVKGCRKDIAGYKLYRRSPTGDFELYKTIKDTLWADARLDSYAYCYKVSAFLANGTESDLSVEACNDNCPFFLLPNVLTPNGDGFNDVFSADFGQLPDGSAGCPRFVLSVDFRISNRWGREVFASSTVPTDANWVAWDGRDRQGKPLAAGVYYYVAEVEFNITDSARRRKILRGWVNLLR